MGFYFDCHNVTLMCLGWHSWVLGGPLKPPCDGVVTLLHYPRWDCVCHFHCWTLFMFPLYIGMCPPDDWICLGFLRLPPLPPERFLPLTLLPYRYLIGLLLCKFFWMLPRGFEVMGFLDLSLPLKVSVWMTQQDASAPLSRTTGPLRSLCGLWPSPSSCLGPLPSGCG